MVDAVLLFSVKTPMQNKVKLLSSNIYRRYL